MANAAAETFWESQALTACISSSDPVHADAAAELARPLKSPRRDHLVLAGHPADHEADYRAAGIDRFIFMKCDVLGTLTDMLSHVGVIHD